MDTSKYKKLFFTEASQHIQALNKNLLKLEKKPTSVKVATELMRSAHTLKSLSASMGYQSMSKLCHAMEDLFEKVRQEKSRLTKQAINTLFSSFDAVEKSLDRIKRSNKELDINVFVNKIKKLALSIKGLGKLGKKGKVEPAALEEKSEEEEPEGEELAERPEKIKKIANINVDVKTLDALMDLTEELLVNKMRLAQVGSTKKYDELPVAVDNLGRLVSDLQYNVMQARMVPVDYIFDRFPRMVRDLAAKEKKKVDLKVSGGDIQLDRSILDKLGEPLVHLLRNAVDHGVQTPAECRTTGLSETGTIKLSVARREGYAVIEVVDDGHGIDLDKIKQTALDRNIIGAKESKTMSKQEIINLIYHPKLSTSKKVTKASGRGIGLNIVKTAIENLGGHVFVESPIKQPQKPMSDTRHLASKGGTKFTLKLPLTIAIIKALLIKVVDQIYAIPLTNVERTIRFSAKQVKTALDREIAVIEGQDYPLVRMNKLFNFKAVDEQGQEIEPSRDYETMVVVKKEAGPVAGLIVDKLISEQEIIIKPLSSLLRQNKGYAGATILGDGRVALILDIPSLI